MKKTRHTRPAEAAPGAKATARGFQLRSWHVAAGFGAALLIALMVYGPALSGPFLFDDVYLPFYLPGFAEQPLVAWLRGMRPALMFTFWMNHRIGGVDPGSYHLFNVFIHAVNALLVFLLSRRLLQMAAPTERSSTALAVFCAALFLLHPLQTESVAYIASRSESLSAFFFLAAFLVFVQRGIPAIGWVGSAAVLVLFALAGLTKEHTAVLPALLLLTDYFWNPGFSFAGIRRNWRLYVPMAAGAALGGVFVARVLLMSNTAGFGMKDLPWNQYLLTQFRVIWTYLRLALLPLGLNVDHDVPISRSFADPLAIAGFVGLLAVTGAAIHYRRRFPLAAFGWLFFLILLAPTSSVVPIRDVIAERRMYLPLIGLLWVAAEFIPRLSLTPRSLAASGVALLAVAAVLTWNRNQVWAGSIPLWEDTVAKSPGKSRPHFQLAYAYYHAERCTDALPHYERASQLAPAEPALFIDWALALDCANRPGEALAKLTQAAAEQKTAHVYSLIGMMHGKAGRRDEALAALDTAAQLDAGFEMTYVYRGNVFVTAGEFDRATAEYTRALQINPGNEMARQGLAVVQRRGK